MGGGARPPGPGWAGMCAPKPADEPGVALVPAAGVAFVPVPLYAGADEVAVAPAAPPYAVAPEPPPYAPAPEDSYADAPAEPP